MSKLPICNMAGQPVGEVDLSDLVKNASHDPQTLQDAVVAHRASQRSGNASTKTKGEVAGSGKKPWKQKGTGRARAGYRQSPVWRGGGVVFGPKPRDYTKKMTRKGAQAALGLALGAHVAGGGLTVVDQFSLAGGKTKDFVSALKQLKVQGKALVILDQASREVLLASRNLAGVEVCEARNVNTYQLVRYPRVVVTKGALAQLQSRLTSVGE